MLQALQLRINDHDRVFGSATEEISEVAPNESPGLNWRPEAAEARKT